jgi:hypothetical protein
MFSPDFQPQLVDGAAHNFALTGVTFGPQCSRLVLQQAN